MNMIQFMMKYPSLYFKWVGTYVSTYIILGFIALFGNLIYYLLLIYIPKYLFISFILTFKSKYSCITVTDFRIEKKSDNEVLKKAFPISKDHHRFHVLTAYIQCPQMHEIKSNMHPCNWCIFSWLLTFICKCYHQFFKIFKATLAEAF